MEKAGDCLVNGSERELVPANRARTRLPSAAHPRSIGYPATPVEHDRQAARTSSPFSHCALDTEQALCPTAGTERAALRVSSPDPPALLERH